MSTSFVPLPSLPAQLSTLAGREMVQVTLGKSEANVWRVEGAGETLFLKSAPVHPLSELPGEAERLAWLNATAVPSPKVRDAFVADGHDWLLMTALPGRDLTQFVDQPALVCQVLASALRSVHALDPRDCPFDHRLDARLAAGMTNAAAGRVDETDFDTGHIGWTAEAVIEWLLANRPQREDLVVTHGDVSLPNIMSHSGGFSGVIDCGRLGVADRWQDLAIACRSLKYNCGPQYVAPFLAAYGAEWDAERYAYYCALDELF